MRKRLLHSVLAVSFSASALFTAAGGYDVIWDSAPASAHTRAGDVVPPDVIWDLVPAAVKGPGDVIWDSVPAGQDA
ncbi:hypothetical protein ACIQM4_10365 [Streptomyces sp. NPDC091272]|uniref:hypothetical protein n=1 Tax=Streptomyces sp. NPDC091272 TaxID=3365981 RepID=UPI0037FA7BF5